MEYREKLVEYVEKALNEYLAYNVSTIEMLGQKDHVINMGVSILETKFPEIGPGYSGGGFVSAVVSNDLMEAIGRADSVNVHFLKFYCQLMYNFSPYQIGYREEASV